MRYLRRSKIFRSVVLPLTLLVWLSACHKWVAIEANVVSPTELSSPVRVTLTDGEEIKLEDATVTADSLFGKRDRTSRSIRFALEDVTEIEEAKSRPLATVGLVFGVVIGVGLAVAVVCAASGCIDIWN